VETIAIIVALFLILRFLVTFTNFITRPLLNNTSNHHNELVSILIPLRNEEKNIRHLVENLKKLNYKNCEVICYDDQSEDRTFDLLDKARHDFPNLTVLQGDNLPEGWLGKNWACHQLSRQAQGEYLLFIDADISLHPSVINAGIDEMKTKKLALLSIFPDQQMLTLGEKVIVPIMHFILLNLLPLRMVYTTSYPSLSAANGQFMMFRHSCYHEWHQKVKNKITEDIEIMKLVKRHRLAGEVLLGGGIVNCRMYNNFKEGINGFTKNILSGFGQSYWLVCFFLILIFFGYIPVILTFNRELLTGMVFLIIANRVMISLLSHQKVMYNIVLHPAQILMLNLIAIRSISFNTLKILTWKGRNISIK